MNRQLPPPQEVVRRGEEVYERKLKALLEPSQEGKVVVVDVDSGDYEVDTDALRASQRLRARLPEGLFYATRVGFRTLGSMGGGLRERST
jgi:hypothetical protein